MKRVYLACPYGHSDPMIMYERFGVVTRVSAKLMEKGYNIFSPVSHTHQMSSYMTISPTDHDFWLPRDYTFISIWAEELWILLLKDWEDSVGVRKEQQMAEEWGKPVKYVCPDSLDLYDEEGLWRHQAKQ